MHRHLTRRAALALAMAAAGLPSRAAWATTLPRLAVLDAELSDDHANPDTRAAQTARLATLADMLRRELREQRLYEVVDLAPAAAVVARLSAQRASMRDCDVCADEIGRALGIDLVMVPWVYKVSELILMLNLQIYSVSAGRIVHMKGVQMRGNRDDSWQRATRYMVRDMAEHRAANPGYGQ